MDRDQLLRLYDLEERQNAMFYNSQREVTPHVIRFRPLPGMKGGSYILYSRLDEVNADEVIRQEIAYFEQLGRSCEWKLYDHDRPADLRERLAAHGFEIEEPEALMVLDMTQTPEALKQPILHDVRRITDPALIPAILNVQQTVWAEKDIPMSRRPYRSSCSTGSTSATTRRMPTGNRSARHGFVSARPARLPACGEAQPCRNIASAASTPRFWPCAPRRLSAAAIAS